MRRFAYVAVLALASAGVAAAPAAACGGLVGENGTIQLTRTTTLAAYHDGVERYVTSFEFSGDGRVGRVDRAASRRAHQGRARAATGRCNGSSGRSRRRARDPVRRGRRLRGCRRRGAAADAGRRARHHDPAGGGDAVGRWAIDHGFLLTPDAPEVLDFYSQRSPIFMAARFDASRAAALGQQSGDGTPIMLTIPTDEPVGAAADPRPRARQATRVVDADVFLLTDERPDAARRRPGLDLARSEAASATLLDDLRGDKGMGWVPDAMWLSYLKIGTRGRSISLRPRGLDPRRHASVGPPRRLRRARRLQTRRVVDGAARPGRAAGARRRRRRDRPAPSGMSPRLRAHRLVTLVATTVVLLLGAGAVAVASAGQSSATHAGVLGPGPVTVTITIDRSRFSTDEIRVRPHTEVRFVLVNHDPIGHEFIVGGPEVHARHANGHEAYHPPVPGEVSVPADARASTTYGFHAPGPVEFACHLPGHYQYGMHGIVRVTHDVRPR